MNIHNFIPLLEEKGITSSKELKKSVSDLEKKYGKDSKHVDVCYFVQSLLGKKTIAAHILGSYRLIENRPNWQPVECNNLVHCEDIFGLVMRMVHKQHHVKITSVHVVHSLILSHPDVFERALKEFRQIYKKLNPHGTSSQQILLRYARKIGNEIVNKVKSDIEETSINTQNMKSKMDLYLTSKYYPYDQHGFEVYQSIDDANIRLFFTVHYLFEYKYKLLE